MQRYMDYHQPSDPNLLRIGWQSKVMSKSTVFFLGEKRKSGREALFWQSFHFFLRQKSILSPILVPLFLALFSPIFEFLPHLWFVSRVENTDSRAQFWDFARVEKTVSRALFWDFSRVELFFLLPVPKMGILCKISLHKQNQAIFCGLLGHNISFFFSGNIFVFSV